MNLGLRHLDGALTFDPGARRELDADVASRVVLLDAFVTNVDRTPRNPNLLWWRGALAPIDHGAALYWQHDWDGTLAAARPERGFALVRDHVLLPWAGALDAAGALAARAFTDDVIDGIAGAIPDDWLAPLPGAPDAAVATQRLRRLAARAARRDPGLDGGGGPCPNVIRLSTRWSASCPTSGARSS